MHIKYILLYAINSNKIIEELEEEEVRMRSHLKQF
jgi:hypothetical protein